MWGSVTYSLLHTGRWVHRMWQQRNGGPWSCHQIEGTHWLQWAGGHLDDWECGDTGERRGGTLVVRWMPQASWGPMDSYILHELDVSIFREQQLTYNTHGIWPPVLHQTTQVLDHLVLVHHHLHPHHHYWQHLKCMTSPDLLESWYWCCRVVGLLVVHWRWSSSHVG